MRRRIVNIGGSLLTPQVNVQEETPNCMPMSPII
jgi:hypothetical protein